MTQSGPATPFDTRDAISRRAGEFFERRNFGEWTAADQAELDAWIAESTLHRIAYLRLEGIAADTRSVVALRPFRFGSIAPDRHDAIRWRGFMFPLLAAASLAFVAALAIPYVVALLQPPDRNYSTDVGGRTLLKFTDGTEIELNTDSVMRSRMTTAERTIWLERGEAWFHVAHDSAHPFTVVIGSHRVTDLGTEFFVRRGGHDVEVGLVSGRAMLNTDGTPAAILKPGDDAVATPVSLSVMHKTRQQFADELAWRRGMLVFRKTKLVDVVREFNRYNAAKLVIADPSVADETVSADIRTDDFEDFLNVAQTVLGLRVEREGNEFLISRGAREETKKAVHRKHGL